eukprot:5462096-Prymnesium_polylepis.2
MGGTPAAARTGRMGGVRGGRKPSPTRGTGPDVPHVVIWNPGSAEVLCHCGVAQLLISDRS